MIVKSLDDESIVQGTTDLVKKGEQVFDQLEGLKTNSAMRTVMEHLDNDDIEWEFMKWLQGFDIDGMVKTVDLVLTDVDAREQLVSQMKDTCLDFILRILPSIRIEQLKGHDNGCDWEIGNIAFSNFHFRKENVHVALGKFGDADGDFV